MYLQCIVKQRISYYDSEKYAKRKVLISSFHTLKYNFSSHHIEIPKKLFKYLSPQQFQGSFELYYHEVQKVHLQWIFKKINFILWQWKLRQNKGLALYLIPWSTASQLSMPTIERTVPNSFHLISFKSHLNYIPAHMWITF